MPALLSNYDKYPVIEINGGSDCWQGWKAIGEAIRKRVENIPGRKKIIAMECYPGILDREILTHLPEALGANFVLTRNFMLNEEKIHELVFPDVTDDEIFGYITRLKLEDFFDRQAVQTFKEDSALAQDTIYVYGPGATLLAEHFDLLVYFDMPRWEGQLRFRRNEVGNLGLDNMTTRASLQYKQAFFVDWRVCDRHKKLLMNRWDLVVDTTVPGNPKMVVGADLNKAFQETIARPFRLVPFFDRGPWGGQWMKRHFDLDPAQKNYAWGFDCVPEENSLLFKFGDIIFETPGINLVFAQAKSLLGAPVEARFGAEFPIRFDFLDTIEGGNLSLQVHPTNEYIREHFGMAYTQDESYYMLEAEADACVYLGLKENISPDKMIEALNEAQLHDVPFPVEDFVEKFAVKKHDHVLIPAGTVHCSGKNSMVLEISATPYIFTFKLWDWGRLGLDGRPRPINIAHGKEVIDWSRTTQSTKKELINTFVPIARGPGWREEYTGLHPAEFIETRRHWFTGKVTHSTHNSVNVLNLVEGREVIVESPFGAFKPFLVHYAETFIVPAQLGEYSIRPHGESEGKECATIKAFVRQKA